MGGLASKRPKGAMPKFNKHLTRSFWLKKRRKVEKNTLSLPAWKVARKLVKKDAPSAD